MNCFLWEEGSSLIHMLNSIQSGDHEQKLISMKRILPTFFSMDSVHYRRWTIIDIAMKSSKYPQDIISLFQNEGVFREAITKTTGGYLPFDQFHEQVYNLPLILAIMKNRQSEEILENLAHWIPLRSKFLESLEDFLKNESITETNERPVNKREMLRYRQILKTIIDLFEDRLSVDIESLHDDSISSELLSFSGEKLEDRKKLLDAYEIGKLASENFIDKITTGKADVFTKISNVKIPVL